MRLIQLIPAALVLCMSAPALAQDWADHVSREDLFRVNFPGTPKVQDIRWTSEYDGVYPARVHSYQDGPSRYSVTVVDYTDARSILAERAKACPSGSVCVNSLMSELLGVVDYATWKLIQRDTKLTYIGFVTANGISGRLLLFTNPDRSRTSVAIHMHESRLYLLEATVPAGVPDPVLFQQSLRITDKEGIMVRYGETYINGVPPPPRVVYTAED